MYQINKIANLNFFKFRGFLLTKKIKSKTKKQTLIFLRAPKHFNIGKRKVFSLKNKQNIFFNDYPCSINVMHFSKYTLFFFSLLPLIYKMNVLFNLTSVKINMRTQIK